MRIAGALLLMALGVPAGAQTLGMPAGCAAALTVQQANCTVVHVISCEGVAPGQRTVVTQYVEGGDFIGIVGPAGEWLRTVDAFEGIDESAGAVTDPISLPDLLANGQDDYDFIMLGADGSQTRFQGSDRLTGTQTVIDGVTLQDVDTRMAATDAVTGAAIWSLSGRGYVSTDQMQAYAGMTDWLVGVDATQVDESPVTFALPGEDGFLSTRPAYGCADGG